MDCVVSSLSEERKYVEVAMDISSMEQVALSGSLGLYMGGVIWYLLTYINDNWYGIKDSVGGTIILVFFILGCIHAAYMFRKKVNTVKAIDD